MRRFLGVSIEEGRLIVHVPAEVSHLARLGSRRTLAINLQVGDWVVDINSATRVVNPKSVVGIRGDGGVHVRGRHYDGPIAATTVVSKAGPLARRVLAARNWL